MYFFLSRFCLTTLFITALGSCQGLGSLPPAAVPNEVSIASSPDSPSGDNQADGNENNLPGRRCQPGHR